MKSDQSWGFTAAPDFPRICRELAQTGCVVGLVTMKGEKPVTLIDTRTARVPAGMASRPVAGAADHWRVVADDQTKAALGMRPVRVEGFTATRLTEPDPWAKAAEQDQTRLGSLRRFITSKADATWTTGDGTKVQVQAMSDSHLHFALAKAYRGEYPDSDGLKAEAARRLLRTWGLAVEPSKPAGYTPPSAPAQPQPIGRVVQQTIQDSLGDHYAVQVDLVGGPFGLTANVKVDEKPPARPYAPEHMPPYMRSPFDR